MDPYEPNYQPASPRKEGMGCFAKGCLTVVVVFILLGAIGGFFLYKGFTTIRGYVADHPANIRVFPATDAQYQAVLQKIAPFSAAMDANRHATLELTADDLNTLIARDPNFAHLRGKAAFGIAHDEISGDLSIPINADEAHGKAATYWFNGRLITALSVSNGEVELLPRNVEVNGKPLPSWALQMLQNKEFIEGLNRSFNESFTRNAKAKELMSKLRSGRVEGDRLVVTSAGEEAVAPTPAPP